MEANKVYHLDVLEFLPLLEDSSVDLVIADPPYNLNKDDWDKFADEQAYFAFTFQWLELLLPKLKPTASIYLFNTAYNSAVILNHLRDKDVVYRNWITWYKKDGFSACKRKYVNAQETILFYTKSEKTEFHYDDIRQPYLSTDRMAHAAQKGILKNGKRWFPNANGRLCSDVWEIASQRHKQKVHGRVQAMAHPTVKPMEMIERMIKASSREGDLVLDLFSGSGMTSIVAQKMNRQFVGCELDERYIQMIAEGGIPIG